MVDINQLRPVNVNLVTTKGSKMKEERQPLLTTSTDSPTCESVIGDRRNDLLVDDPPDLLIVPPNKDSNQNEALSPGPYDPILNRQLDHPTSNLDTMIHLLKGNIGTGILAMPDAFLNAGLVVGTIGTLLMGAICTHCMHMLVNCSHELCRRSQIPALNFSEVVEHAFITGPTRLRQCRNSVKLLVNIFLVITQIGFCCVYFVFVATNLQQLVEHYFERIPLHWFLLALLLPMILLNWVNNLKYLTPVSLLASILTTTGLGITFFYILQGLPKTSTVKAFAPLNRLPLFFGTAIYAFEGIGVVLPLENNMATPEDFGGLTGVLNTGMVIVACLYTSVGFFGYLRYGDHMKQGSITLNLPQGELLAQSVRLMMALAIFLSYGLQFYVSFGIIWPPISERFSTESSKKAAELCTRTVLVVITFCLAAAIPNLGAVISLVGAVSSSALALIFPPIIEIITFWNKDISYPTIIKDILIMLFGLAGFVFGTYASVMNIVSPYHTS